MQRNAYWYMVMFLLTYHELSEESNTELPCIWQPNVPSIFPSLIDKAEISNPAAQLLMSGCLQSLWLNMAVDELTQGS